MMRGWEKSRGERKRGIQKSLLMVLKSKYKLRLEKCWTSSAPGIWVRRLARKGSAPRSPTMIFDAPSARAKAAR